MNYVLARLLLMAAEVSSGECRMRVCVWEGGSMYTWLFARVG
jgi:hypothetical protein